MNEQPLLLLCISRGDNLAANFSRELADLIVYVIDVAGGEKVPRKGGPDITQSDFTNNYNKIDIANAVGSNLDIMKRDAARMRQYKSQDVNNKEIILSAPTYFCAIKNGVGIPDIIQFIQFHHQLALQVASVSSSNNNTSSFASPHHGSHDHNLHHHHHHHHEHIHDHSKK